MSNKDDESIEMLYSKSCLDLNMDMETKFGGNQYKRTSNQINPKLNIKNKLNKCSHQDSYSLIWTIYASAKTIYPSTINDLIASFHLLISSFFFYL
ncbi:unnamed protein product [Rotaria sp. Silwood1]|nr:unnamed protein product [Rotaria sp. Silwood1]CAF1625298.1 unnamed protein product [Rotaria sp. Silwood1]